MKSTRGIKLVIILMFFTACKNRTIIAPLLLPPEKSRIVTLQLADSLGTITLSLPARYDTGFSWTHQSDCGKPCDKIKYRFQPNNLRIRKETGWIWLDEPVDSVECFTLSHSGYFPFREGTDSNFVYNYHRHQQGTLLQDPHTCIIKSDTVERIRDRHFSIFTIDLYDSVNTRYSKKLLAATGIKGNIVEICFELLTKQKDSLHENFLDHALYYLRTVRFSQSQ